MVAGDWGAALLTLSLHRVASIILFEVYRIALYGFWHPIAGAYPGVLNTILCRGVKLQLSRGKVVHHSPFIREQHLVAIGIATRIPRAGAHIHREAVRGLPPVDLRNHTMPLFALAREVA